MDANRQEVLLRIENSAKIRPFSCLFLFLRVSCLTTLKEEHFVTNHRHTGTCNCARMGTGGLVITEVDILRVRVGSEICKACLRMQIRLSEQNLAGS